MVEGVIFGRLDVAELVWYLFLIFFAGLIVYLRREDRREGYPLEADTTGRREPQDGFLFFPSPKTFLLPHGGAVRAPENKPERRDIAVRRLAVWPGAPHEPVGDPLVDGVGPAAYAERADVPDLMHDGVPKLAPLRASPSFYLPKGEPRLIGGPVYGSDGKLAGVVADLWVDRGEQLVRYIEVALKAARDDPPGRTVLMPMGMASVDRAKGSVRTDSIAAHQFANAPALKQPDQITLYEEERVIGYFGGGYLYSRPSRKEPIL